MPILKLCKAFFCLKLIMCNNVCCLFQVYAFTEGKAGNDNFTVTKLTTNIPSSLPVSKFSLDAIKLLSVPNVTHMFVRSQSNRSRIYHSYQEWKSGTWSAFKPIGDDDNHLVYDFDVVINTFLKV